MVHVQNQDDLQGTSHHGVHLQRKCLVSLWRMVTGGEQLHGAYERSSTSDLQGPVPSSAAGD